MVDKQLTEAYNWGDLVFFQERSLRSFHPQRRSMVPITKSGGSQAPGPLVALGLPLAALTASALFAAPASALITLDSTSSGTFPIATSSSIGVNGTNKMLRAFQMGSNDSYLTNLRIAYSLPFNVTSTTPSLDLNVEAYKVTLSGGVYVPTGPSLGSTLLTLTTNSPTANTPFYTANLTVTQSLSTVLFQAGQSYGLVFSNGTAGNTGVNIGLRRCGGTVASPTPTGCQLTPTASPTLAFGGISYLGGSRLTTTWTSNAINNSLLQQYTFTPVPAPAFMGLSYLGGLLLGSRRLRSRIRKSAA